MISSARPSSRRSGAVGGCDAAGAAQRLEAFGGLKEQQRGVANAAGGERNLPAQQVGPGVLEFGEWPSFRSYQQPQCRIERPGLGRYLRRSEGPLGTAHWIQRQCGRALHERGRRRQPAARLRPVSRALQL